MSKSNKSASNFALILNIPPWKVFGWSRRPQPWVTGDWQLHSQHAHSRITSDKEFFWWNIKSPMWLSPWQPRFGALQLLAFPKTKITSEREEISYGQWDTGKNNGAPDRNWKNYVRSQSAYFEGNWGAIVLCTMFLVTCILFNKSLFFILHGWIPSGQASSMMYQEESRHLQKIPIPKITYFYLT